MYIYVSVLRSRGKEKEKSKSGGEKEEREANRGKMVRRNRTLCCEQVDDLRLFLILLSLLDTAKRLGDSEVRKEKTPGGRFSSKHTKKLSKKKEEEEGRAILELPGGVWPGSALKSPLPAVSSVKRMRADPFFLLFLFSVHQCYLTL